MAEVTFILPNGNKKKVEAPIGLSLMEIAHKNGIDEIEGACEGSLSCATCHVIVDEKFYNNLEEKSEDEENMLDLAFDLKATSRLSCQIIMKDAFDGIVVRIPNAM